MIDIMHNFVAMRYRRRASVLAGEADRCVDEQEKLRILHEALLWVQLAENDEFIDHSEGNEQKRPS